MIKGEPTGHLFKKESFKSIPQQRPKIWQINGTPKDWDIQNPLSYTNFLMSPSLQERFVIFKFGLVPTKDLHFLIAPWSQVNSVVVAPSRQVRLLTIVPTKLLVRKSKGVDMGRQGHIKDLET